MVERLQIRIPPLAKDLLVIEAVNDGEFVRHSDYATLEAQLAELEAENERFRKEMASLSDKYSDLYIRSRTDAVKVKALDEDDYEEITNAAGIAMRRASRGIRGQVITVQDSFDWWVMKETERRILSALEPAAPEGEQPVAYRVHAPEDEHYGTGPDRLQFHPLALHDLNNGYRQTPLYECPACPPSEQAVTEAVQFDRADWFWRVMDPDDSGDTPEQAIHGSMLGDLVVCEIASSFTGPTRFGFIAPVLDRDSDDTEFLHFATEQEAIEAAEERQAALKAAMEAGR